MARRPQPAMNAVLQHHGAPAAAARCTVEVWSLLITPCLHRQDDSKCVLHFLSLWTCMRATRLCRCAPTQAWSPAALQTDRLRFALLAWHQLYRLLRDGAKQGLCKSLRASLTRMGRACFVWLRCAAQLVQVGWNPPRSRNCSSVSSNEIRLSM